MFANEQPARLHTCIVPAPFPHLFYATVPLAPHRHPRAPHPCLVSAHFRARALWFFRDCAFYITMNTTETKHTNTKGTRL